MHARVGWLRAALPAFVAVLVLSFLGAPGAALAQPYKEKKKITQVVRYVAHKEKVPYQGKQVLMLGVESLSGGRPIELVVRNRDMNKREYDPVVNTDHINALKKGDTIKIELDDTKPRPMVQKVDEYKLRPGEADPGTYVFENTFEKGDVKPPYTAVVLSKFDEFTTVAVPQKKNKDGQMEADAEMTALLQQLKAGEVVEAQLRGSRPVPVLVSLERYAAPQSAKFVKLAEQDVEEGQKTTAVELEQDGKLVTALVPGEMRGKKWVSDSKVLGAAKKLKPDVEVVFRARQEGDKLWLKEIEPAPQKKEAEDADSASATSEDGKSERRGRRGRAADR